MINLIGIYLVGIWVLCVLFAFLGNDPDSKFMFRVVLTWPFSITVFLIVLAVDAMGWEVQMWPGAKRFGVRLPKNPEVYGFAMTLFGKEFQIWKRKT
jgi:hypothetical protein